MNLKKNFILVSLLLFAGSSFCQKSKILAAWRALSDYEETLKDGKPNLAYLKTASDAINLALTHEDSKKQTRAHAYSFRINYALFQYNVAEEMKKLETGIPNKEQRALAAYGNVSLLEFEKATQELNTIKDTDPKFLETIQMGLKNGNESLDEDELRFAQAALQMKIESSDIASGKFKAKKYQEAADYFYKTALINTIMNKTLDTTNFYNACVSASRSKNNDRIIEYNKNMIDLKAAAPYNYSSLSAAYQSKNDTAMAFEILKKGRAFFPADAGLLTEETNLFISSGKAKEALYNLKTASVHNPTNANNYIFIGNIYNDMANPKDKEGRDLPKPANFEELFINAETNYKKALELSPSNKDLLFNVIFNLGAMYNNYGGMLASRVATKITDMVRVQRENEEAAAVYYKKAIPYLEQALNMRPADVQTMRALRILYLKTSNEGKAKEMSSKLQANGSK